MNVNPYIARFANEPALLAPGCEDRFRSCLEAAAERVKLGDVDLRPTFAGSDDDFWTELGSWSEDLRPYVVKAGVLYIPVKGVLLHDFPYTFFGWATGYAYIQRAFERGMADGNVKGIALVIDSPGGMVAGCFDAVDKMVAGKSKPVRAFAHESAYSAAYAIACIADEIVVSRTGGVGSVGVVTTHVDLSGALEQAGVKITFIHAGEHKVDGNPYEPLGPDVKARIQERIDELYAVFVSTVARNRGLDEQAVRDTEALCFTASQALSNGFADQIGALDDALAAFAADLSNPQGDEEMSEQKDKPALTQADIDDAVAAANATAQEAQATAVAEARTAERTRIAAILGSDEAEGRAELAQHLALETDTAADAAVAILAKSLKAEEQSGGFNDAMGSTPNPEAGAGGGSKADETEADETVELGRSVGLACLRRRPAASK